MFDMSQDRFRIDLGNRSFFLTHTHAVWFVLVSFLVLSRALVVLIAVSDSAVHAVSSFVCEYRWTSCTTAIKTESIGSLEAAVHWSGDMFVTAQHGPRGLIQALCRWDCGWYAYVWSAGYDVEPFANAAAPWAFFPLFPLAIAMVANWWPSLAVGYAVVLNHLLLLATAWLLYLLTRHLLESRAAGLAAAVLFIVSPMSLYSSVPLSESLFNALSIGAMYAAYRGRWLVSGLAMALLTANRPYGLFIVLPVLIIAMRQVGFGNFFRVSEHAPIWFALALAPMGICLYALYLHSITGDALAFANVQEAWGRVVDAWPIDYPHYFNMNWDLGWFWRPLFLTLAGMLGLATAGYLAIRKLFPEAIFLGSIAILVTGSDLNSLPRYLLAIWPGYLALALILRNKPKTTMAMVVLFIASLPIMTITWINGHVWLP